MSFGEFIKFLVDFPVLFHSRYYKPIHGIVVAILVAVGTLVLFMRTFRIEFGLLMCVALLIGYRELKKYLSVDISSPEVSRYAKPTDVMKIMRENDRNTLLFGPYVVKDDKNSRNNETLRGFQNSGDMGEQYGYFTGMTLYSGPVMYQNEHIEKVYQLEKLSDQEFSADIILLRDKYDNANSVEERLELKKQIFKLITPSTNDEE